MRVHRLFIFIGVVGLALHWWKSDRTVPVEVVNSPNGFVSVVMPDGARANTVVILAPVNCPSDAAQRADALAVELTREGIPNLRSASFRADIQEPTEAQAAGLERAVAILNGPIPAVFVNGRGKANPTVAEVVSEYRLTR